MTVTEISPCAKNKKRVNVYVDDEFCFACYIETAQDEALYKGREITPQEIQEIKEKDSEQWAWRTAVNYVTRAAKTEKQVFDKLVEKGIDKDAARATVDKLREYRLVDDEEYARLYAERLYEKYGKWVVIRKLREKGISKELIDLVTAESGDENVLDSLTERLMNRYAQEERSKRIQKIMRSLSAKGFEFDDIRRAISRYEQSETTGSADEE